MVYLKNITKYLICVASSMIAFMIFGFVFSEGKSIFIGDNIIFNIPVYLGIGWGIYQIWTKKLNRNMINYNWILIKLSVQTGVIVIGGMFVVLYFTKSFK